MVDAAACTAAGGAPGLFFGDEFCVENPGQAKKLGDFCIRKDLTGAPHDIDIPAVSQWGLVVLALLVLTAATVVIMRRRATVVA